jgi:hypothetical protein
LENEDFWSNLALTRAKNAAAVATKRAAMRRSEFQAEVDEEVLDQAKSWVKNKCLSSKSIPF